MERLGNNNYMIWQNSALLHSPWQLLQEQMAEGHEMPLLFKVLRQSLHSACKEVQTRVGLPETKHNFSFTQLTSVLFLKDFAYESIRKVCRAFFTLLMK